MRRSRESWLALVALLVVVSALLAPAVQGEPLETVRGTGCYTYGDEETPDKARRTAQALARREAVESYRVFVQAATTVKNHVTQEDLVHSASAAVLRDVQIEKEEEQGRRICLTITAKVSPAEVEELLRQKVKAKEMAEAAQAPLLPGRPSFAVRVWTNKPDGRFLEGERLIVSVQSERDGYLKLDYYVADGNVVHLVPNIHRGDAFIRAGQVYTFGGGDRETFIIQKPFGAEAIKVIVSTQPFDAALTASRNVDDGRRYLDGLASTTRDLKVTGRTPQWAEASVGLTTASRAANELTCTLAQARGVTVLGKCVQ
ncbi:DUF4384 domain-containing protein [Nitrospira sp. Kam-Ns4a]